MSDEGSCVTLIFYRINPKWWKEPALNLASAVCQMSNLTHCELSIGEETSNNGQTMKNVARVFNDSVGGTLFGLAWRPCPDDSVRVRAGGR